MNNFNVNMDNDIRFSISPEVEALGVIGAYFLIEGMTNVEGSQELDALCKQRYGELSNSISESSIANDALLKGFRELHEKVGCSNRKFVASPENLLIMLSRSGRIPRINGIVDIYNLVSCSTRLALGAHDADKIAGNVELRLTRGDELFWPLGLDKAKPVRAGEYAYIDSSNEVLCRLEVRQVEKTKVTLKTQRCFYIVQGNRATGVDYVRNATEEVIRLTRKFCGGEPRMLHKDW